MRRVWESKREGADGGEKEVVIVAMVRGGVSLETWPNGASMADKFI